VTATRAFTVLRRPDGRELAFAEFGTPSGTPVFALHGTPGSHRLFALLDDDARRLGVRVIAPDRPGYGASDYVPERRLHDWPDDVAAIAAYLAIDRFGVFGVSGGGPHAAVCAHAFGARLLGAAIVSGIAEVRVAAHREGMLASNRAFVTLARVSPSLLVPFMALADYALRRFGERLVDRMSRALPAPDRRVFERPEVRRAFVEESRRASRTTARAAAQDFGLIVRPLGFDLAAVAVPVDVFWGGLDVNVPPSHGERQAQQLPMARRHYYPDEAHLLVFDHVEEILRAAAGLDRL
jgi:pimeloyl-ACP methyl ester carboxylesterase